jgi:hypothetical protein
MKTTIGYRACDGYSEDCTLHGEHEYCGMKYCTPCLEREIKRAEEGPQPHYGPTMQQLYDEALRWNRAQR